MKNRKFKTIGLSLALVSVIGLGGTLAVLSDVDSKTNTFTSSSKGVDGYIEETMWEETGKEDASDYRPGDVIAKDPKVVLEAGTDSAYVALKLEYLDNKGNVIPYDVFQKYATIDDLNTTDWTKIATKDGADLYAYNNSLTPTASSVNTNTLFNKVTVNAGMNINKTISTTTKYVYTTTYNPDGTSGSVLTKVTGAPVIDTTYYDVDGNVIGVYDGNEETILPKFEIRVTAYAVQSQNTQDTYQSQLIKLAGME